MKKLWLLIPALLIAGLVFMGCPPDGGGPGPGPGEDEITWEAEELEVEEAREEGGEDGYYAYDISGDALAAIKAAEQGSKLRLYFTVPEDRHDWGLASIGVEDGASLALAVPTDQTGTSVIIETWVSWVLATLEGEDDDATLTVKVWKNNGATLTKIELVEPSEPVDPPSLPKEPPSKPESVPMEYFDLIKVIVTTGGSAAVIPEGKGNIEGDDLTAIKEAADGSVLRFYIRNVTDPYASRNGWNDVGAIGASAAGAAGKVNIPGADGTDWIYDLPIDTLNTAYPLADATFIFVNPYNGCIVTMCELWSPQEGVVMPQRIVNLVENWQWLPPESTETPDFLGYQAIEAGLFTRIIWEGDIYTLTGKFTSDVAVDELTISLVDNSQAAGWWAELSDSETIEDIDVDEEKTVNITLTATDAAIGTAAADMKLVFKVNSTTPGAEITLKFWEWSFTKTSDGTEPGGEVEPPPPPPEPTLSLRNLGAFNIANDNEGVLEGANQPGWAINGHNNLPTDLEFAELAAAKYLVIEMFGPGGNADGFGGIRIVLNNDGTNWAGQDTNVVSGWLGYPRSGVYYMVIELATLTGWEYFTEGGMEIEGEGDDDDDDPETTVASGTNGYICIASWPISSLGFVAAYITDMELVKDSAAVDVKVVDGEDTYTYGFVTKDATIFDGEDNG